MIKTRIWILLLGSLLLVSLALCFWPRSAANTAEIWSDGILLRTVSLAQEQSFTVESAYGSNTITISGGKIAVTQADCPGGDCLQAGWRNSGRPIVCLPHHLVIQFANTGGLDAVSGVGGGKLE